MNYDKIDSKYISRAGLIASMYILLMLIQMLPGATASLTFGPIQLRLAEGLVLLPFLDTAAIPGVFIGCLVSNTITFISSGFGIIDIVGGSLVTLIAAILTSKMKSKWTAMLPPIVLNAFIVSIWVSKLTNIPYIYTVLGIGLGELLSVGIFGSLIIKAYKRIIKTKR